jgi:hypothetical protein
LSLVQLVRHAVPPTSHLRPPPQAVGVPGTQVPEPSQVLAVSMPLLQLVPHGVLDVG